MGNVTISPHSGIIIQGMTSQGLHFHSLVQSDKSVVPNDFESVLSLSCIFFVCFVRVSFCPFSLPFGVGGWLWFVIMALPGLFY